MDPPTQLHASHSDLADFDGFSQDEIFDGDICKIDPKTISTTIYIKSCEYNKFNNDLKQRYGEPVDKGKHGLIFRGYILDSSVMEQVVITSYPTTCTLNIQGRGHSTWVNIVLKDIIRNVSLPNHHPESSVIDFSLAYDDEFPPLSQSTPHRVQDTVKHQHSTSSNVLPQTECELNSPSNSKQVQELTAQLALYKNVQRNEHKPATANNTTSTSSLLKDQYITQLQRATLCYSLIPDECIQCIYSPNK